MDNNEFNPRVNLKLIEDTFQILDKFIDKENHFVDMIKYYKDMISQPKTLYEVLINNMFIEHIVKTGIVGHPNTGLNNQFNPSSNINNPTLSSEVYQQILRVHKWNKQFLKDEHLECMLCTIPSEPHNLRNMSIHEHNVLKTLLTEEYLKMMNNNLPKDYIMIDPLGYVAGSYIFENGIVECMTNPIYARETKPEFKEDFIHIAWYESYESALQFYETAENSPSRGNLDYNMSEFITYQDIENKGLTDKIVKMSKMYVKWRKFATMLVQESIREGNRPMRDLMNQINKMKVPKMDTDNWDNNFQVK